VDFLDYPINVEMFMAPCIEDPAFEFEIQQDDFLSEPYKLQYRASESNAMFPVPGFFLDFGFVEAGIMLDVSIDGDFSNMDIELGIDACGALAGDHVCGSDLSSWLPFVLIRGSFDFSDYCDAVLRCDDHSDCHDGTQAFYGPTPLEHCNSGNCELCSCCDANDVISACGSSSSAAHCGCPVGSDFDDEDYVTEDVSVGHAASHHSAGLLLAFSVLHAHSS